MQEEPCRAQLDLSCGCEHRPIDGSGKLNPLGEREEKAPPHPPEQGFPTLP